MDRNHKYLKNVYIGLLILLFLINMSLLFTLVKCNEAPIKFAWTINEQYTEYEICSGRSLAIENNKLYIGLYMGGYFSFFQGETFNINGISLNESSYGSIFDGNAVKIVIDNQGCYYTLTFERIISSGNYGGTYTVEKFSNDSVLWSTKVDYQGILDFRGLTFDNDYNVYVIGYNSTIPKVYYAKFNATGNLQYQKLFDETGTVYRWGGDIITDSENNILIVGSIGYPVWSDRMPMIIKCDHLGNQIWNTTLVFDPINKFISRCILVDLIGNIYVAGHFYTSLVQSSDFFLIKCDALGNIIWSKTWAKQGDEQCKGIALDSSNNIILVGETTTESDESKMYLMKCNQLGSLKWSYEWEINGTLNGVALDPLNNIYVVGEGAYSNIPYIAKIIEIENPDYTLLFVLLIIGTIALIGVVVVIIWKKKVRSK